MKIINRLLLCCLICSLLACSSSKQIQKENLVASKRSFSYLEKGQKDDKWYKTALETEPVEFHIPQHKTRMLPNGLKAHFLEDHELPLVKLKIIFPGGSLLAQQLGEDVALSAFSYLLRSGGSGDLSPYDLDQELERLAGSISVAVGSESITVSLSSLKDNFSEMLDLYFKVLQQPSFSGDRLSFWKIQQLEAIQQRKDRADTIASIAFQKLLMNGTVYADPTSRRDVKAVNRTDLLRLHRKYIIPKQAHLVLSGALNDQEMTSVIKRFAKWNDASTVLPEVRDINPKSKQGIYFVEGPFEQCAVTAGQLTDKRLKEDHYQYKIFSKIFGASGFTSRLFGKIREELGLAYTTYGASYPGKLPGKNIMYMKTKDTNVAEAIDQGINVIKDLQTNLITKEEMQAVHKNIENTHVFKYSDYFEIISRIAYLDLIDYPEGYEQEFITNLKSVTRQDLLGFAQKRWKIDELTYVVVCSDKAYQALVKATKDVNNNLYGKNITKLKFNEDIIF